MGEDQDFPKTRTTVCVPVISFKNF